MDFIIYNVIGSGSLFGQILGLKSSGADPKEVPDPTQEIFDPNITKKIKKKSISRLTKEEGSLKVQSQRQLKHYCMSKK